MKPSQPSYNRFGILERAEHLLLLLSFTLLAITGLPQKFPEAGVSLFTLRAFGGLESTRSIHHVSAIVLIVLSIFHLFYVGYKIVVLRRRLSMLPGLKDINDLLGLVAYNLGLTQTKPDMDRYNFGEKVEYWAVVWGTVIMAVTGYMLWNPIATSNLLPGEIIPAAKAAHGAEAILAVLSILIWHMYNVHVKYFNRSMFTGKLSRHEMEEEHAAELRRIREGRERPLPAPQTQWQRTRLFLPVAGVLAAVFMIFTYRFFTAEQTAIITVPPQQTENAYVPVSPPALPTATPAAFAEAEGETADGIPTRLPLGIDVIPPEITSHPVDELRQDCLACHAVFGMVAPAPLDHYEMVNDECADCHEAAQEVAAQ